MARGWRYEHAPSSVGRSLSGRRLRQVAQQVERSPEARSGGGSNPSLPASSGGRSALQSLEQVVGASPAYVIAQVAWIVSRQAAAGVLRARSSDLDRARLCDGRRRGFESPRACHGPVAQLDRAPEFESGGRFDSCWGFRCKTAWRISLPRAQHPGRTPGRLRREEALQRRARSGNQPGLEPGLRSEVRIAFSDSCLVGNW